MMRRTRHDLALGLALTVLFLLLLLCLRPAEPADLGGMPVRPFFHSSGLTNATQATKIVNGDCANAANWTVGADWTVGPATCSKAAGGASTLSQTSANMATPMQAGDVYLLTWTATALAGGSLTPSVCGVTLPARTAAATYRDYARCTNTNDLVFTPSVAGVTATLDNISLQFVAHAEADQVVAWEEDSAGVAGQGAFFFVDEGGNVLRYGQGQISPSSTSAALPPFSGNNDPTTGLRINLGTVGIVASGTQRATLGLNGLWGSSGIIGWTDQPDSSGNNDLILRRDGPAILQMGTDAAAPATQTLKGPDATGAGPTAGGILQLQGGAGVGGGAYGAVQVPNSQLLLNAGTLVAPAYSFTGASNYGFYFDGGTVKAGINGNLSTVFVGGGLQLAGQVYVLGDGANVLQLGSDGVAPLTQTLKGPDATGGGPTAGGNLTLAGGTMAGASTNGKVIIPTTNSGRLTLGDGSATYPSVGFDSDDDGTGTGIYRYAANTIGFSQNGIAGGYIAGTAWHLTSSQQLDWNADLILFREGAAALQMGVDAAAPVAYLLKSGDPRAGTDADTAGANLTLAGGRGTGTGAGGDYIVQASFTGGAGNAHNTLVERARVHSKQLTFNDVTTTTILTATVANSTACNIGIAYGASTADATNTQAHSGNIYWASAATNAGAVTSVATESTEAIAATAGTYTDTWSTTTAANTANLRVNFDSSLNTATTLSFNITYSNGCVLTFP